MKKIISSFLILSSLFFLSCTKKDYSIRFVNNYTEGIYNVVIGNAKFGDVGMGVTTEYLFLSSKSFMISGTSVSGRVLSTSETVSGRGRHKWTVTLNAAGGTSITEDPA